MFHHSRHGKPGWKRRTHHTHDGDDPAHLVELVHTGEEWVSSVHLHQDTSQRPGFVRGAIARFLREFLKARHLLIKR